MSEQEIHSALGFTDDSRKVFMGIYEKNIQYYADTKSSTVTVTIYEDAKAGRKVIDTIRVRMEYDFLHNTLELSDDVLISGSEESNAKIVEATIRIVKSTYKHTRGTFPKKEIVWSERQDSAQ